MTVKLRVHGGQRVRVFHGTFAFRVLYIVVTLNVQADTEDQVLLYHIEGISLSHGLGKVSCTLSN